MKYLPSKKTQKKKKRKEKMKTPDAEDFTGDSIKHLQE